MSDKMTRVYLPSLGTGGGLVLWDAQNPATMIARFRIQAKIAKEQAERILDASAEDFIVETYRGPIVQKDRTQIWPVVQ